MKKSAIALLAAMPLGAAGSAPIVGTPAYEWRGDSIIQGRFTATAPNSHEIISTYEAQPGYFMPVEKQWKLKNDISGYPSLETPSVLHRAIYNMGLDEMVNAVERDTTLRTGKEWAGVWTRDVSYSILLSMAYMQPEASRISLMKKVTPDGRIIQDTGSGGAWPVSSDRMIWAAAAWEVYKVTGDRGWLDYIYPIIKRSLDDDLLTVYDKDTGLVRGETSFIDWREQSYPKWMQTVDIYRSLSLSTSVVHAHAWDVLMEIAKIKGDSKMAATARSRAIGLRQAINRELWMPQKGYYAMYLYGRDNLITNPRAETLGESLAIMWNVADSVRAREITENNPTTPFGPAIFYPQIADMPSYHNNALWPWVGAWWGLANAKAGNAQGVMESFGALFRPAALFCTNKENFRLDNGDIATELNSSNMLWCLAGNIALTHRILFGLHFDLDGLHIEPFVPEALGDTRTLRNFPYRNATLDITVSGFGSRIKSFKVNGKEQKLSVISPKAKGHLTVEVTMDSEPIPAMKVNHVANASAPLTPVARLEGTTLTWEPIEYIGRYIVLRDGKEIATQRSTTFDASAPGEYQVIGVSEEGIPSFASMPLSTRKAITVEMPGEKTTVTSPEVAYRPESPVAGFSGRGFAELDMTSAPLTFEFEVPEEGAYSLTFRYANGNGPVNTENRCGIRTVTVDGERAGVAVMPQRGRANWDDWGTTNALHLTLKPGRHTVTVEYQPSDANMNGATNHALIDRATITRINQ